MYKLERFANAAQLVSYLNENPDTVAVSVFPEGLSMAAIVEVPPQPVAEPEPEQVVVEPEGEIKLEGESEPKPTVDPTAPVPIAPRGATPPPAQEGQPNGAQ